MLRVLILLVISLLIWSFFGPALALSVLLVSALAVMAGWIKHDASSRAAREVREFERAKAQTLNSAKA